MTYLYCWKWNDSERHPIDEMSEDDARRAFDDGPQVGVAAGDSVAAAGVGVLGAAGRGGGEGEGGGQTQPRQKSATGSGGLSRTARCGVHRGTCQFATQPCSWAISSVQAPLTWRMPTMMRSTPPMRVTARACRRA